MPYQEMITEHLEWPYAIRKAIARREPLEAHVLAQMQHCPLDAWLGDPLQPQDAARAEARLWHQRLHLEAQDAAALVQAQQFVQANRHLLPGSAFSRAHQELGRAWALLGLDAAA